MKYIFTTLSIIFLPLFTGCLNLNVSVSESQSDTKNIHNSTQNINYDKNGRERAFVTNSVIQKKEIKVIDNKIDISKLEQDYFRDKSSFQKIRSNHFLKSEIIENILFYFQTSIKINQTFPTTLKDLEKKKIEIKQRLENIKTAKNYSLEYRNILQNISNIQKNIEEIHKKIKFQTPLSLEDHFNFIENIKEFRLKIQNEISQIENTLVLKDNYELEKIEIDKKIEKLKQKPILKPINFCGVDLDTKKLLYEFKELKFFLEKRVEQIKLDGQNQDIKKSYEYKRYLKQKSIVKCVEYNIKFNRYANSYFLDNRSNQIFFKTIKYLNLTNKTKYLKKVISILGKYQIKNLSSIKWKNRKIFGLDIGYKKTGEFYLGFFYLQNKDVKYRQYLGDKKDFRKDEITISDIDSLVFLKDINSKTALIFEIENSFKY